MHQLSAFRVMNRAARIWYRQVACPSRFFVYCGSDNSKPRQRLAPQPLDYVKLFRTAGAPLSPFEERTSS